MKNDNNIFPSIEKKINNFIEDQEGNIPAAKLLTIGTLVLILGTVLTFDAFAKHGSHKSHTSHSSSSYHRSHGSHSNSHSSHASGHGSHASHASHTSHSNTSTHSNANYSRGGDLGTPTAPYASSIKSPPAAQAINTEINVPKQLSASNAAIAVPTIQTPLDTVNAITKEIPGLNIPPDTPQAVDEEIKKSIID